MALQRYGVGDCEGGMRYDLEPMDHGDYAKVTDIEDMAKQLQTAITALQAIANHRKEIVEGNPAIRYDMHTTAQDALRKMGLLT